MREKEKGVKEKGRRDEEKRERLLCLVFNYVYFNKGGVSLDEGFFLFYKI